MAFANKAVAAICLAQILRVGFNTFRRIDSDDEPYIMYSPNKGDMNRTTTTTLFDEVFNSLQ